MKKLITLAFVAISIPSTGIAQNCAEVIKLSLTTSTVVQSEEQFETDAREFCSSYQRNSANGNSAGANVGYGGFSFGGTSSSTNARAVARNVCENTNSGSMRDDAYSRLIQEIAPQAYSSYDNCVDQNRSFNVEILAGNTPTFVPITVNFVPQTAGEFAEIAVITDDSVSCNLPTPRRLDRAGSFIVACRRSDVTRRGSITVINQAGALGALSVPWTAYTALDGVPVDIAQNFMQATSEMNQRLDAMKGSVLPYNASSCPKGTQPYTAAFGRFVRGLDLEGGSDPDRTIGSIQEGQIEAHTHSESRLRNNGDRAGTGSDNFNGQRRGQYETKQSGETGGSETRPVNVALLYCEVI